MSKITQAELARRAGVSRQAVSKAVREGLVIKDPATGLIDMAIARNHHYIINALARKQNRHLTKARVIEKFSMRPLDIDEELSRLQPRTIEEQKTFVQIQKMNIEMQARLGELMYRPIGEARFKALCEKIDMFETLAERVAGQICIKLNRQGREMEISEIIKPETKKIIQDFKAVCLRPIRR